MQKGKDNYGDDWGFDYDEDGDGLAKVTCDRITMLTFYKDGAKQFAASVLEEIGEESLASAVRAVGSNVEADKQAQVKPSTKMPTRNDIALFILRTIGERPAEYFAAYGADAYRSLADGIHKMFQNAQGGGKGE